MVLFNPQMSKPRRRKERKNTANGEEGRTWTVPSIGNTRAIGTLVGSTACTGSRTIFPGVHTLQITKGDDKYSLGGHTILSGRALRVEIVIGIDSERACVHVDDDVVVQVQLALLIVVRNVVVFLRHAHVQVVDSWGEGTVLEFDVGALDSRRDGEVHSLWTQKEQQHVPEALLRNQQQ